MKRKIIIFISIVLIALIIISIVFAIVNNHKPKIETTGNIDEKTFYALTKFGIDSEKIQIVDVKNYDDAGFADWYNVDFNKNSVVRLQRSSGGGAKIHESYEKSEYQLADEYIEQIKIKLEELRNINNDDEELVERPAYYSQIYNTIKTKDEEKTFYLGKEGYEIILDIISIISNTKYEY